MQNLEEWLLPLIGEDTDGDYLIFDCPGQIELYTHLNIMRQFVEHLESWSFRICGIFTIDSHFVTDGTKFIAGAMTALSSMINLQIPYISVLTKLDLLRKKDRKRLEAYIEPDPEVLLSSIPDNPWNKNFLDLTATLGRVLEEYSLVKFVPLNLKKSSHMENLILTADMIMGVSEDAEVKVKDFDPPEEED